MPDYNEDSFYLSISVNIKYCKISTNNSLQIASDDDAFVACIHLAASRHYF